MSYSYKGKNHPSLVRTDRIKMRPEAPPSADQASHSGHFQQSLGAPRYAESAVAATAKGNSGVGGRHNHVVDHNDAGPHTLGQLF
jgi:hypothetical protein